MCSCRPVPFERETCGNELRETNVQFSKNHGKTGQLSFVGGQFKAKSATSFPARFRSSFPLPSAGGNPVGAQRFCGRFSGSVCRGAPVCAPAIFCRVQVCGRLIAAPTMPPCFRKACRGAYHAPAARGQHPVSRRGAPVCAPDMGTRQRSLQAHIFQECLIFTGWGIIMQKKP